ncbi:MAG: ATP-binding protein [Nocardioides sp.]
MTTQVATDEELPPDPTSAGRARRLLRTAMTGHDDEEILDAAQLAISEIVTNALVHAGTTMRLRILVADRRLRVELTDGSPRLPSHRDFATTAATGRGLMLVEQVVSRWGAYPLPAGKVVWFEISDGSVLGEMLPEPDQVHADDLTPVVVELHRMPLLMHQAWQEHAAALLREVMLVRLDTELSVLEEHASASDALGLLAEQVPSADVGMDPDTVMASATEPEVSVQRLLIEVPRASLPSFDALDAMLDEALHLAEDGQLLAPPTQPEIQAMRLWICNQVRHQAAGGRSAAWPSLAAALPPVHRLPALVWNASEITEASYAVLAADDTNRIVAVSRAALALLGYDDPSVLVGRRLVSIIPERFHQAHVAGFTLHLVNGRSPLLGHRVSVPVLRRDGSETQVGLLIEPRSLPEGRTVFTARFFD